MVQDKFKYPFNLILIFNSFIFISTHFPLILDNLNHFLMGPLKMLATLKWWPHQKLELLHKYGGPMSDNFLP